MMHSHECNSIPVGLLQRLLAESNINRILESLTHFVESTMPDVKAMLCTFDPEKKRLLPGSCPSLPIVIADLENGLPVGPHLTTSSQAAYWKTAILTRDISVDKGWEGHATAAKAIGIHAAFSIPILSTKSELLGTFTFLFAEPLTDYPVQMPLFETLTNLAAITLERYTNQRKTKAILAELQSSQERLNLALQSQKMGVWDWYVQVDRLIWDEATYELYGVKSGMVRSLSDWERVTHPDDVESVIQSIQRVFREGGPYEHQFRVFRFGEVRHLAAVGYVVRDSHGDPIRMTGLSWDITEKVVATKKLDQERAKAIANSKMASLGEMASGIAHEINNPLTIILNRANQLKARMVSPNFDPEWGYQELLKVEGTVERIAKIIRGLRAFSRNADNDPMISCELNSIIEETLELCREKFRLHGVTLRMKGLQHVLSLKCRPAQISQVLLNFFNNSFDAVVNSQEPWIELDACVRNQKICLRITDSGLGIPSHIADRMMDPFFSTKEVGRGTGLGLSISKGILEEHEGRVWLDREHSNTSFVIELPLEHILRPVKSSSIPINFEAAIQF
jgi:PAS domain S-box-containing protein